IEPGRIRAVEDGDVIDLGDRRLTAVHTPVHAPHHMALLETAGGTLFTGDAAGVWIPGMRAPRPATPPPSFDADAALDSLRRMAALAPQRLLLTHFGPVAQPAALLADLADHLPRWCAVAKHADAARAKEAVLEAMLL